MKVVTKYLNRNWQYGEFKKKLNKMEEGGYLRKMYPLSDEDKLEAELYSSGNGILEIKHLDETKEIRFLLNGNEEESSRLLKLIEFEKKPKAEKK